MMHAWLQWTGAKGCCARKRMDLIGKVPDGYLIATMEGITKRGMEEPPVR